MAMAGLEQIRRWGVEAVGEYTRRLTDRIGTRAAGHGLEAIPPDRRGPHLTGVRFPQGLPDGLVERLAAARVYVSVRGSSVRIAPHVYNTDADVDRLFEVLSTSA